MRPQSASALLRGPPLTLSDIIKKGYLQRVRDLVDLGMDINSRDTDGKTPLMLCALVEPEVWGIGIARQLLENGASLKLRDKSGLNALHHACIYERYELSRVFLRAIDFDLNQTDKYGNTALHYAVKSGNITMIRLLVDFLKKYSMPLEKVNKAGLSALDLAYRQSSSESIELLTPPPVEKSVSEEDEEKKDEGNEKDEELGDTENNDLHLSLTESNLKSFCEGTSTGQRHQFPRPKTALLKRRRASSVSSASSISSGGRSQSRVSLKSTSRSKASKQSSEANEKDAERIIRCVSLSDFRNTKEFVFKLTAMPYDELEMEHGLPSIRRPQSAWTPRPEPVYHPEAEPFSWRTEFKKLYVEYEFQCSTSWRDAAKTIADQIPSPPSPTPPQPEEEEEKNMRDSRKGRRSSMASKTGLAVEALSKDKRRHSGNIKLRKMSSSSASGAPTAHIKPGMDANLASSSESLNSSNSSKKKDILNNGGKNAMSPTSDKDSSIKSTSSSMQIPALTETLVDDGDDATDDASLMDSNRLSVLSDIAEDAA